MDRHSYRNHSFDPYDDEEPIVPRLARRAFRAGIARIGLFVLGVKSRLFHARALAQLLAERPGPTSKHLARWFLRRLLTIPSAFIILWFIIIYRGEYLVFEQSLAQCDWPKWEAWPSRAVPHRIAFVADPQLVDPHTYPGRPWPLSTLTVKHTDLYLRRAYSRIQRDLDPNSILFLGDLFDGGREWSTEKSQSPEERYHKYGESYWQKEYRRFSNIFFRDWRGNPSRIFHPQELVENTRIIASLPGNHDLGFGATIPIPVRDRFNAFFGDSNRVDIIGNHTFVSLDTVSLSARDQEGSDPAIYRPAEEFLDGATQLIARTERKHIQYMAGDVNSKRHRQSVEEATDIETRDDDAGLGNHQGFPTILLTHVPLHRPQGTPCGPLRERFPPTRPPRGQTQAVFPDDRNSLHVNGGFGWQYQNVITQPTSHYILDKLGGAVGTAFSGDDHDYCEVVHRAYPSPGGGVHEITVKSISWAMGVRRPGFVLASLWHEVDAAGAPLPRAPGDDERSLQTRLCLLPDQLGVFVSYVVVFGLTLVGLVARAVYTACGSPSTAPPDDADDALPLLPSYAPPGASSAEREKRAAGAGGGYGFAPQRARGPVRSSGSGSELRDAGVSRAGARARPTQFGLVTAIPNPLDPRHNDEYDGPRQSGWRQSRTFATVLWTSMWDVVKVAFPFYLLMQLL